eukprot:scaffold25112_cov18-Tisochrysis_lutea.AAC.2
MRMRREPAHKNSCDTQQQSPGKKIAQSCLLLGALACPGSSQACIVIFQAAPPSVAAQCDVCLCCVQSTELVKATPPTDSTLHGARIGVPPGSQGSQVRRAHSSASHRHSTPQVPYSARALSISTGTGTSTRLAHEAWCG